MNQRSQSAVAQFESGQRVPNLEGALALQVLFRQRPHRMFPGFYEAIEDGVMRRAVKLIRSLEPKADRRSAAKREFLENLAREAGSDEDV